MLTVARSLPGMEICPNPWELAVLHVAAVPCTYGNDGELLSVSCFVNAASRRLAKYRVAYVGPDYPLLQVLYTKNLE